MSLGQSSHNEGEAHEGNDQKSSPRSVENRIRNKHLETLKSSIFKEARGQTWNVEGVVDRAMKAVMDRVIMSL